MFSGEVLLSSQDVLNAMRKQIEGWSNCAIKVFSRHSNSSSDQLSFQRELSEMADVSRNSNSSFFIRYIIIAQIKLQHASYKCKKRTKSQNN